jgi:signal transduction histidine kinase
MIDTLSHEVRTPLSVMSVYAQLAVKQIREGRAGEQTMADLSTISEEAKRLAELANDALRLSALTDGEIVDGGHEMRPLDIAAVAGQLSSLFAPMAEKSGCALTAELPDNLPVRGDAGALTRLLWNLLDNALTHSNGRNIEVRAWRDADIAKVTVKDDGSGIAPEILPHIFERGVSGATDASGRTSQPRSMGIGLAICRQIAEEHGGAIIIKSGQGKGTEAVLTLPLYRGEDE